MRCMAVQVNQTMTEKQIQHIDRHCCTVSISFCETHRNFTTLFLVKAACPVFMPAVDDVLRNEEIFLIFVSMPDGQRCRYETKTVP